MYNQSCERKIGEVGMYCLVYHHVLSTRFIVSECRINVCAMKDEGYNTVEILKKNYFFYSEYNWFRHKGDHYNFNNC